MGDLRAAIIGAGFSGLVFALKLLESGAEVDLFEEHRRVGFPQHCTGLVSAYTQQLIGPPAVKSELGRFEEFIISGPSESVAMRASSPVVKLDRVRLEELMLERVESLGGRTYMGVRAAVREDGTVLPSGRRYDVVLLAEGLMGSLRGALGLGLEDRGSLWGVNEELELDARGTFVAMFSGDTSDRFFSWYVPLGRTAIVGTAARDPRLLGRLLSSARKAFGAEHGERVRVYGGPIVSSRPPSRLRAGRVIVVGDAAGMTKPLTGGGLYPSAEAASRAAKMISEGRDPLSSIEDAVRSVLKEQARSYRLARLLHERPEAVDLLAAAARESGLAREVSGKVDYDRHMTLLTSSARGRGLLRALEVMLSRDPGLALRLLGSSLLGYLGL